MPEALNNDIMVLIGTLPCKKLENSDYRFDYVKFDPPFGEAPEVIVSFNQNGVLLEDSEIEIRDEDGNVIKSETSKAPAQSLPLPKDYRDINSCIRDHGIYYGTPAVLATNISPEGFQPEQYSGIGGSITWVAVGHKTQQVIIHPSYLVLSVIYAPPGTKGGGPSLSSITYENVSTTTSSVSASQSFQKSNGVSYAVSAGGSVGIVTLGVEGGLSFSCSQSNIDSQSFDIKRSFQEKYKIDGSVITNGINHDHDEIYLLLMPTIKLTISSSAVDWELKDEKDFKIQKIKVGWLLNKTLMPPQIASELQSAGITEADYEAIALSDPFVGDQKSLFDSGRLVSLNCSIPYVPADEDGGHVSLQNVSMSESFTNTVASSVVDTYETSISEFIKGGFFSLEGKLKKTSSWTWTNKSSQSKSTGTSKSATIMMGGSSYDCKDKATHMAVYLDTLFKTFAFVPVIPELNELAVKGTLIDDKGTPLPAKEVNLEENGNVYRTFTNAKGEYSFFGNITGPAILKAEGVNPQFIPQRLQVNNITLSVL